MRLLSKILHATRSPYGRRTSAGFSMVELSIVLAIISVVAVMGLELTAQYMGRTAYKATQEKIDIVDKAIARYVKVYNKLPCPAGRGLVLGDACYGKELNGNGGAGTCVNTLGACTAGLISGTTLHYGDVPVRDLGLPLTFMVDGYGMRIRYIASGNQVYNRIYSASNNFETTNDAIQVRSGKLDSTCGVTGNLCQSRGAASYLLLSGGADKRGMMAPNNTGISYACDNGANFAVVDGYTDTANCRFGMGLALVKNGSTLISPAVPNNVFYDSRYNNGTTDAHFDDIIKWRSRGSL